MTGRRFHDSIDPHRRVRMLSSEDRARWLHADDLVKESGISQGMTCIDLGCGAGALSFPLVNATGEEGAVYAVDTSAEALDHIRAKDPPENLKTVNSEAARTGLESGIADFCFMLLLLHEVEQPERVLAEAYRLLKPGGKAVALEWREDAEIPMPPRNERIGKEKIEPLMTGAGLSDLEYKEWGKSRYIMTGSKNTSG